jgi:alpha-soluble NSF attachment protein
MAAADTYRKCSELHKKLESPHDAATTLTDAANCYKRVNPPDAINSLIEAGKIYTEIGRFSQAAKVQKEIADLYEKESDFEKAIEHYQLSADFFLTENQMGSANPSLIKIGMLAAQLEQYDRAIGVFEELAERSLESTMLRYNAKEYLFKAGLCHMAALKGLERGVDEVRQHLERYQNIDVTFMDTREAACLWRIVDAFEKHDLEIFQGALVEFDRVTRLDEWKTALFLRVRDRLTEEPDLT